ncbi:MAG: TIR domain-containing protein [Blastocatellia bacterium]
MAQPDDSISIFISYSHHDDELRQELDKHLSGLRRQGVISVWHDRRIVAGEEWAREIDDNLEAADIILLLVSPDFIASDYCYDIEMKRAVERHDAGEAIVIPVILRACLWQGAPFGKIQGLPRDAKPVASATNRDEAFTEVVTGIQRAIEKLRSRRAGSGALSGNRLTPDRRLLPYLCDRGDQETVLAEAVRRHQQERAGRPLVCVVHGDEQECHAEYLERMQYRSLRKFFNLEARRMEVKDYSLRPPRRAMGAASFWAYLGQALLEDSSAAQPEIWQFIARHEEPMMLILELLTEDFDEPGESLLRSVIDFCDGWPELPPGRDVILCVSLKYQRFDRVGLLDFRKKKLRQLNQSLRGLITGGELAARANVSVVALPELEAIPRSDVERWKRGEQVRGLPDREIRAWFADKTLCNDKGSIPMELLAEKLRPFIE